MFRVVPSSMYILAVLLAGTQAALSLAEESLAPQYPHVVTNSLGIELKLIPAGEFLMGSPDSEDHRRTDETQHAVRISRPFYMGIYEVTNEQYESLMPNNPAYYRHGGFRDRAVKDIDAGKLPVQMVTRPEAQAFVEKLNEQERSTGRAYRLPTEAEWEYACRAGSGTPFSTRLTLTHVEANIQRGSQAIGSKLNRPEVVGSYAPNAFGLYDMHGNVAEWVEDTYESDFHATSAVVIDPVCRNGSEHYLARGGSWNEPAKFSRSASRGQNQWGPRQRMVTIGFRIAMDADAR